MEISTKDRAKGAILGAFIGDAIALGCHWYYDLEEQYKDYGKWITDFTSPKEGRYHENQKKGDLSQSGYILKLMINSILDNNGYNQKDFCKKIDNELFTKIDGNPMNGPGGYTSQSIREVYRQRVEQKLSWDEVGSRADTTEAIERTLALAIRYVNEPKMLAKTISHNTFLTQVDDIVGSMTVAFGAVLAQLIKGEILDENISTKLMKLVKSGDLPFHAVTSDNLQPPKAGAKDPSNIGLFASPDALLSPSYMAKAANDKDIKIEPAWKVSFVYGMPCAIYHILPACYYLAARFKDDFESAILHALNGGGQNQARSILTGALVGAQVGFQNIPQRFIDGLNEKEELLKLADELASQI
ncbi:ADP-ribosylglycohydrolase family protein [Arcobacter arenosus]|jgi:ADP-ribosylglycohydrolase|uniref:ADP-ribosylglycohydrolase family protein n=1 Tax=Arcobacter arenosus TaxID=2576037 RepID=A0A5R8Y299_9BACT|nr:ADP-ribosylglycohydrolase family protein [Arcobacter arenosus]TLP39447.1 ADP-ribosylglycohydrolase family protein [Arcobacter arenosus]